MNGLVIFNMLDRQSNLLICLINFFVKKITYKYQHLQINVLGNTFFNIYLDLYLGFIIQI